MLLSKAWEAFESDKRIRSLSHASICPTLGTDIINPLKNGQLGKTG
jgi:hypothetical protein